MGLSGWLTKSACSSHRPKVQASVFPNDQPSSRSIPGTQAKNRRMAARPHASINCRTQHCCKPRPIQFWYCRSGYFSWLRQAIEHVQRHNRCFRYIQLPDASSRWYRRSWKLRNHKGGCRSAIHQFSEQANRRIKSWSIRMVAARAEPFPSSRNSGTQTLLHTVNQCPGGTCF